jgi:cytochrome c oxidase subunit 3
MSNLEKNYMTYKHTYHLVDPSPWPILTSFSALVLTSGGVMYMHSYKYGGALLSAGLILITYSATC